MAELKGNEYTNAFETTPAIKLSPADQHGRIRVAYGSYDIDSAQEIATTDTIDLFKLPKGATVIGGSVSAPASGATGTFDIGWLGGTDSLETADPNGLFAAVDPGNAAIDRQTMTSLVAGYRHKMLDEVIIQLDCSQITADAGGDKWEVEVYYVVD
jgi:hypothetical protein